MFTKKRGENMKLKLTAKEASELIGVGYSTFKRYAREHEHRKKLVIYRYSHKNVRYCRDSVLAFDKANMSVMA